MPDEIGLTGLNFDQSGLVLEEELSALRGKEALRVYKQMWDNDPIVASIIFVIMMLVRQVDWTVLPHPEGSEEDAKFIEECMLDLSGSWNDFISEILSMIPFGFSFFEIVYKKRLGPQDEGNDIPDSKYDDGKTGWQKFAFRAQESLDEWKFDSKGGITAFVQRPAPDYNEIPIPMRKGLLFRTTTFKNNPEGRSVLRAAYFPWREKRRIEQVEGMGIERDLAGLPFAEVDAAILSADATPDEIEIRNGIMNILKNVRQDRQAGIMWPSVFDENGNNLYKFSLLTSGGSRTFETTPIIQRKNQYITMVVLADFILLGHEKLGSLALSSDKTDVFALAISAWLDSIEEVINQFAVTRLLRANAMDTTKAPTIKHGDLDTPDLLQISQFISSLQGVGMPLFPDTALEKWLRKISGMPEKSEEDEGAENEPDELSELTSLVYERLMSGTATEDGSPPNSPSAKEGQRQANVGNPNAAGNRGPGTKGLTSAGS